MNVVVGIILVLLLVAANGFFVAVEFSLVAADRTKLEARAAEGHWAAKVASSTFRRLSFHLSGAQLGITITSLVLGVTRIEGNESDERAFYLNVARTVVDVFLRGSAAREQAG